jgi:hypothetical protein
MSQCREFAGLADSFHTLFGVSIWWPVGLRWNEGFSERRHAARASASATAAPAAHSSIVSRGKSAKRGPQAGEPAALLPSLATGPAHKMWDSQLICCGMPWPCCSAPSTCVQDIRDTCKLSFTKYRELPGKLAVGRSHGCSVHYTGVESFRGAAPTAGVDVAYVWHCLYEQTYLQH